MKNNLPNESGRWGDSRNSGRCRGFTLVELLTVLAIIGILAAILIPTVNAARAAAHKAKTKVMFNQWAIAMEQFKQEYGYYPKIDGGSGNKIDTSRFVAALTGRRLDGTPASAAELGGNAKLISFYTLDERDLDETRTRLIDAFGNMDIAVIYDRDGDGVLKSTDGSVVSVQGRTGSFAPDVSELDLARGLRASVIFYSAGRGEAEGDLIMSWR